MRVYKRGNRWWAYESVDGKISRRSLGPDVRTRAQALAVAKGRPMPPETPKTTLRAFFNEFLIDARIRLAPSTLVRYKRSFRMLMHDLGDFSAVESLTTRRLNNWAARRLERGLSPEGINLELRHIRAALRRGEDLGLIAIAPKVDMVKTPRRLPRHLTKEEFERLLAAEHRENFKRFWRFLFWTCLRRREGFELDWQCVTLGDKPTARVIGKGDRERVVPLIAPAIEAMGPPRLSGPVFQLGSLDNVTAHFKQTARRAGLPKARLHDLRHSGITYLVGQGVPLKLVQDIAGHSIIQTTMNYAKIFTGDAHHILNAALGF